MVASPVDENNAAPTSRTWFVDKSERPGIRVTSGGEAALRGHDLVLRHMVPAAVTSEFALAAVATVMPGHISAQHPS